MAPRSPNTGIVDNIAMMRVATRAAVMNQATSGMLSSTLEESP